MKSRLLHFSRPLRHPKRAGLSGPVFSFTTREHSSFNKPTLLAMAGWYLDHPSREGGLPYLLLGFSFSSDLLSP